ncbi:MAG: polysaccharide biosynthesis C-terminal domain-containing protein [Candidatus Brocadiaceae bacterium]|nr:polysaccharide biosynthesis C-terminal domain-containing protein [Candidatus Brocadiaceae bacterium]
MVNTIFIAYIFGATATADIFLLLYNLIFRIGERIRKSINVTFVPVYINYKINTSEAKTVRMKNAFATKMLFFSILGMFVYAISSPYWVKITGFGFVNESRTLAVNLVWILSPVIFFFVAFSICESIFISENRFWIPSISSVFSVLGLLFGILFLVKYINVYGLAVGTTIGTLISVIVSYLFLKRSGLHFSLTLDRWQKDEKIVSERLFPVICSNIILQIVVVVDKIFATHLGEGYSSTLSYAFNISMVIPSIITPAMLTSVLPTVSKNLAEKDYGSFSVLFNRFFKHLSFVIIPICGLLLLLGDSVIQLLLHRGKFDNTALENTVIAFNYYLIGVMAHCFWVFVAGILMSMGKVKYLVRSSLFFLVISIAFDSILMKYLGYIGLPLATSLVFIAQLALFLIFLVKDSRFYGFNGIILHIIKVSIATFCMMLIVLKIKGLIIKTDLVEFSYLYQVLELALLVIIGSASFMFVSRCLKIESMSYIFEVFRRVILRRI